MNLEQAKKDIDRAGDEFRQHGEFGIEKTALLFRVATDAVAELERAYAVMSVQKRIEISPTISMVFHPEGWIVHHKGRAVNVDGAFEIIYLPFQAALASAWELEASHE